MQSALRRPTPSLLLSALVALAACRDRGHEDGGTEGDSDSNTTLGLMCEGAPAEEEAAVVLAEAYCTELYGCHCPLQDAYGSFDECVLALTAEFRSAFDTAIANGLTYNPGCTDQQVFFAQAFGCDFPDAMIDDPCVEILCEPYAGDLLVGEMCTELAAGRVAFSDCAPGLSCNPECGGCVDDRRTRLEGEPCGTCFGFCDEGLTCSLEGEALEGTCIIREDGFENDPCSSSLDCQEGLYCPERTCVPLLDEGETCMTDSECASGLYCNEQLCRPRKATGEPCSSSEECAAACSSEGQCTSPLCAVQGG